MTGPDPSFRNWLLNWRFAALYASVMVVLGVALWPHPPVLPVLTSDAAQHGLAFGVLTLAARLCWPAARWQALFAALSGLGLAIEVLQGVVPTGRNPELGDWLVDCAAIGAMLLALGLFTGLRRRFGQWRAVA